MGELAEVDGTPVLWDTADPMAPLAWLGQNAVVGDGRPLAVIDASTHAGGRDPWLASDWQDTVAGEGDDDPWGSQSGDLGVGYRGELGFDSLVWLRNRAYDPATRAFLSPDPWPPVPGTAVSGNPYHYAGNDPVGMVDPLGLRPLTDDALRALQDQRGKGALDWVANHKADTGHGILDVAGLIPVVGEIADGVNAVWYAAEGDWVNAGLSAAGMIPFAGVGATGAKWGVKGAKAANGTEKAAAEVGEGIGQGAVRRETNEMLDADRTSQNLLTGGQAQAPGGSLGGNPPAPRAPGEYVDLASPARRAHILDGETYPNGAFGGGHRAGTGFPMKTEFPASWSDDKIMHEIASVARDPSLELKTDDQGRKYVLGTRDGIEIHVGLKEGEIWTAFPTNVPRNP
jgi:RHS repeat-associated protein